MKALVPSRPHDTAVAPTARDAFSGAGVLVALAVGALCAAVGIVVSLAGLS